jgi:dolichol-phosphate mannosyltransferase
MNPSSYENSPRKLESLTVVVPGRNEEESLPLLYAELIRVLGNREWGLDILFVDDGSTDGTLQVCRQLNAKDARFQYVSLSRNFGHQLALTAGLDLSRGRAVVTMDADMQDPPEVVLEMIKLWERGIDVAYGQRRTHENIPVFKRLTAQIFYRLLRLMSNISIPPDTGDFRLIDRRVMEQLKTMREKGRYIRGMVSWVGFDQRPVLYDRPGRHKGSTKYPLFRQLRLAWEGISAFSSLPLRMATMTGIFFSLLAFAMVLYYVFRKIYFDDFTKGWASIMVAIFAVGGVQLLFIGIVGEYLAKTFEELKGRPLYIIQETSESLLPQPSSPRRGTG